MLRREHSVSTAMGSSMYGDRYAEHNIASRVLRRRLFVLESADCATLHASTHAFDDPAWLEYSDSHE
jgi:hypothetical protein